VQSLRDVADRMLRKDVARILCFGGLILDEV